VMRSRLALSDAVPLNPSWKDDSMIGSVRLTDPEMSRQFNARAGTTHPVARSSILIPP
jgi:hypothetical protein